MAVAGRGLRPWKRPTRGCSSAMTDARKTQESRILWLLQASWPNWVPAPELAKISLQYSRAIHSLRHRDGWLIENDIRTVDGKKHGFFKLGSRPVPPNKELRRTSNTASASGSNESLFGDLSPDRTYKE